MNQQNAIIDHSALKANQYSIIFLALSAFVLDLPVIALSTAAVMILGTLIGKPGFIPIYTLALKPLGLLKPDPIEDNAAPHRFAQGFGGVVLLGASLLALAGAQLAGWALVWLVIFLAALNAFAGFCVGCFIYYRLSRLRLPGFTQNPPQGSRAGFKPVKRPAEEAVNV
ncbi:MAG TPA: DUF4395 domain-containing protein [Spirochaetaceae bacterium]|jgi:hypothetical protein|nr:DUF4395 domain-containing protein [Spirochaetaceae bacterium]